MSETAYVDVRYFASIREALGAGERLAIGDDRTVAALRDRLVARGDRYAEVLGRHRAVRAALDRTLCNEGAMLLDGAEVGFFPPVTGG